MKFQPIKFNHVITDGFKKRKKEEKKKEKSKTKYLYIKK